MRFLTSAYGPPWTGINGTGVTATGVDLRDSPHVYIVAVDPRVIPLHSRITVTPNPFGIAAVFRAEDTGSAIKGNRVDFYEWRGHAKAYEWGMRYAEVHILGKSETPVKPTPISTGPGVLPTRPAIEGAPTRAGGSAYDYSHVVRSARRNIERTATYLRGAGNAIRRLQG